MQVVIDIGNTSTKIGFFISRKLNKHIVIDGLVTQREFKELISNSIIEAVIVSSVIPKSKNFEYYLEKKFQFINMATYKCHSINGQNQIKVPFKNLYKTPLTLGQDRIANVTAAVSLFKGKNTLIIDVGTCLKLDFVNNKGQYLGGSISPGVQMRFNALHHFTGKLPLVKTKTFKKLTGSSTEESIRAGVQNGMYYEILGSIEDYLKKYNNELNIILTGGDYRLFAERIKKAIFVDPFFTLKGLQIILENNIKNSNA